MSHPAPEKLWEPSAELIERSRLREYMRWAMRITEPENTPDYQLMSRAIGEQETVPMVSLATYIGRDAARPSPNRRLNRRPSPRR